MLFYMQVVAVRSVDQSSHSKEARELRPVSHVAQHPVAADGADFSEGRAVGGARGRNPPQKPPPYIPRITERNRVPSGITMCHCIHVYNSYMPVWAM